MVSARAAQSSFKGNVINSAFSVSFLINKIVAERSSLMGDNRQDLQSLSLVPSELMYQFSSPVSSTNERPEDNEHEKVTK